MNDFTTIREEMNAYLGGEITLHEFYEWFMVETWDMTDKDDEWDLQCQISLWFAEYTSWWEGRRHRSEEDLRVLFAGLA